MRDRARRPFDEELDDEFGETDDFDEEMESDRGGSRRPRGRPAPGMLGKKSRRAGGGPGSRVKPGRGKRTRGRVDWGAVEDEEESYEEGRYDSEDEDDWSYGGVKREEVGRRRKATARRPRRGASSLVDLCTPLFGHAAILPRDPAGTHPGYEQFRQEVLKALQRIDSEAEQHGVDREDAAQARYALSLFMDEQVIGSEWSGRAQWASEPLNIVLLNDPEGGINFFTRLEQLGDRQRDLKKIFLLCLALGYKGKYSELDPTQQATQIGEIRQKLLRSVQDPLDNQDVLFPEAYEPAIPLQEEAPPPPKWWLVSSIGITVGALLIWIAFFVAAGKRPKAAQEGLEALVQESEAVAGTRTDRTPSGRAEGSTP